MNVTLEIKTRRYRLQQPWRVMQNMVDLTQFVLNLPHTAVSRMLAVLNGLINWVLRRTEGPVGQLPWLLSLPLECAVAFMLYCSFVAVFVLLSGLALLLLVSALVISSAPQQVSIKQFPGRLSLNTSFIAQCCPLSFHTGFGGRVRRVEPPLLLCLPPAPVPAVARVRLSTRTRAHRWTCRTVRVAEGAIPSRQGVRPRPRTLLSHGIWSI